MNENEMIDWKAACVALGFSFCALAPLPGLAQTATPEAAEEQLGDKQRLLAEVISDVLVPSRLPEIYADLRRAVRDAYLPAMRDIVSGAVPGSKELGAEEIESFEKTAALLDYTLRASDELEPFLAKNKDAIIGDIATLHAKYLTAEEIEALGELAEMPAMRKIFNTGYTASRLVTGYSYEDMHSYYLQADWLNDVRKRLQEMPGLTPDAPPPSQEKIAKASAIITDLLRVSRIDEMVAELMRFGREVKIEAGNGQDGSQEAEQNQLEWFEFFYNLQKSFVLATGPSMLAAMFDEEQLERLHLLVLSPVIGKTFGMLYETVRAATSLTGDDVRALQAFSEEAESKGLFEKRTPEQEKQLGDETQALADIWWERARQHLTPETREGLDKAIADFERMESFRNLKTPRRDL